MFRCPKKYAVDPFVAAISQSVSPTTAIRPSISSPPRNTSGFSDCVDVQSVDMIPVVDRCAVRNPTPIQLSSRFPTSRRHDTRCPNTGPRSGVHIKKSKEPPVSP